MPLTPRGPRPLHLRCTTQTPAAHFAAVSAAVFTREPSCFRLRAEDLRPLPVLENDLVAARQDLERLFHPVHVIEARRSAFAEAFEEGRIHEVAHGNSVHVE